ncbi:hypothetical protein KI387_011750, partial [Taxus chinensis]
SMATTSTKPNTYTRRKKSPVKKKTPEVEEPRKPFTKEIFPEEEEETKSPVKVPPLKKKQRVEEEANTKETDSLEKYVGKREGESEEDNNEEDEPEKD